VDQQKSQRKVDDGDEAVIISTIHQAKGLEWEAVFVAAVESGVIPHSKSSDEEEERRLAFVALTRAKRYLSVSHSYRRGDRRADPSSFVREMAARIDSTIIEERRWPEIDRVRKTRIVPQKPSNARVRRSASSERRPRRLDDEEPLTDHPQVEHPIFGVGVVLSQREKKLVVRFADGKTRKILATHVTPVRS
jgi:DNA helicase-2/ATP-dependent DNA helicase PcrA